ncbi:MAG: hypothetical protein JXB47_21295 [Anaerolineae bacterium]|nr:hypothetical protein [Anaerolineae bacterium]
MTEIEMTFRQMNLSVFKGEPTPYVFFQPRFEPWYEWHKIFDCMPEPYRDLSLLDMFDLLKVSIRYIDYYTGIPHPIVQRFAPEVDIHEKKTNGAIIKVYETPHGDLTERLHFTQDETWRTVEFPVKGVDDLKKLRWLLERMTLSFVPEYFEQGSAFVGDRGEPQFYLPKSTYQAMAQTWMKFETFIYALADYPAEVEATMRLIDDSYDALYEEIIAYGDVKIVNFGENLHSSLLSPRYFERYLVPFYEKRANQLKRAGIYTHIHVDGHFRSLLPYLKDLPFDGYEALTPLPQGDVALEEIKAHIGDKVLLDGIPAVFFLPLYSREVLMETVERVVELFYPRLVLGVSDEVPEGAGAEAITRLQMVSEWCRAHSRS